MVSTEPAPLLHECGSGGHLWTNTVAIEVAVGGTRDIYNVIDMEDMTCLNMETGEIVRLNLPNLDGI